MSLIVSAMLHHWTAQVIADVKQGYPDIDIAHKSAAMAVPKVPHPNVLFAGVSGVLSLFFSLRFCGLVRFCFWEAFC